MDKLYPRYSAWNLYMKNIISPQSFIDFSYYWLVSSALQRRVWLQSEEKPLFPNLYVVLCGPPATGKGLVIYPVMEVLKEHKLRDLPKPQEPTINIENLSEDAKKLLAIRKQLEEQMRTIMERQSPNKKIREPLLFPVGPDDISYEKLVSTMSLSTRRINSEPCKMCPSGSYAHASMSLALEEMTTLFKRDAGKTMKFLLKAFDCGDYEYSTITRGEDFIQRCCLNFMGGTTPGQIKELLDHKVVDDGLTSRIIMVYEDGPRFLSFGIPTFTDAQLEAKSAISKHIKQLGTLFGQATYAPDTFEYFWDYFVTSGKEQYKNPDTKLEFYYGRKNIHAPKLALAIHFSEVEIIYRNGRPICDMEIKLHEAERAIQMLNEIETRMHLALAFQKKNPLKDVCDCILKLLGEKPMSKNRLLVTLWEDLPEGEQSLDLALRYLFQSEQIEGIDVPKDGKMIRVFRKITPPQEPSGS